MKNVSNMAFVYSTMLSCIMLPFRFEVFLNCLMLGFIFMRSCPELSLMMFKIMMPVMKTIDSMVTVSLIEIPMVAVN